LRTRGGREHLTHRWIASAAAAVVLGTGRWLLAQPTASPEAVPVAFGADEIKFDAQSQSVDASGHVRVDEPPFHVTSHELRLRRVPMGVVLEGQGVLAFCPCLGTPLAVRFSGATLAPPHDVILRNPVLQVFGIPVAWLPVAWLRSPGRMGLLPPDLAWRGADGFFGGGGVHVPWVEGEPLNGLDARAGGYVEGGVAADVAVRTTMTATQVHWDRLHGEDGVAVRASGAEPVEPDGRGPSAAWEIEALRGARAVQAVTDVDTAARPFDRAQAQAEWRQSGWMMASGIRAVGLRGAGGLDFASGPLVAIHRADALGWVGAYDVTLEGGQVAGASAAPAAALAATVHNATSFARGQGGTLLATAMGPTAATLALRAFGEAADNGTLAGVNGAAQARIAIGVPLARTYASAEAADPWVHRTEPRLEIAAIATHASDVFVGPAGRGMAVPSGTAWVGDLGWSNTLGRWGSRAAADVDFAAGAVGHDGQATAAVRARATIGGPWFAFRADAGQAFAPSAGVGTAVVAGMRIGAGSGMHLAMNVAGREGLDPLVARALADPTIEPSSGFLASPGWTGGARASVPIAAPITARAGADVKLDRGELVAAVAALEFHDPCNCVILRATGAHRVGRAGVDAWISVDLPIAPAH